MAKGRRGGAGRGTGSAVTHTNSRAINPGNGFTFIIYSGMSMQWGGWVICLQNPAQECSGMQAITWKPQLVNSAVQNPPGLQSVNIHVQCQPQRAALQLLSITNRICIQRLTFSQRCSVTPSHQTHVSNTRAMAKALRARWGRTGPPLTQPI